MCDEVFKTFKTVLLVGNYRLIEPYLGLDDYYDETVDLS